MIDDRSTLGYTVFYFLFFNKNLSKTVLFFDTFLVNGYGYLIPIHIVRVGSGGPPC